MRERDSNIELLRLICMFMVVFQHCVHLCAFPQIWDTTLMSVEVGTAAFLMGFSYIGVNCFVLISGYYGIKLKVHSALNIYFTCAFYALIGYLLHLYVNGAHVGMGLLYHSLFCISHSKLWFVKCYVGLMLLSPILNVSIQNMSKSTYKWTLVLLTIFNVYFGFIWHDVVFNSDGYTIANFVYLYMIGGYISKYVDVDWCRAHRNGMLSVYIIISILWGIGIILQRYITMPWEEWLWGYNNPLTLIGAIGFFLSFLAIPKFYNKWINWFAAGTFAVYLLHLGDYFELWFKEYVGKLANWLQLEYGIFVIVMGMIVIALTLEIVISVLDKFRSIVMRPVIDKITAYILSLYYNYTKWGE